MLRFNSWNALSATNIGGASVCVPGSKAGKFSRNDILHLLFRAMKFSIRVRRTKILFSSTSSLCKTNFLKQNLAWEQPITEWNVPSAFGGSQIAVGISLEILFFFHVSTIFKKLQMFERSHEAIIHYVVFWKRSHSLHKSQQQQSVIFCLVREISEKHKFLNQCVWVWTSKV